MTHRLRIGMVGAGMIFEETYRPCFERLRREGLFARSHGAVEVELAGIASRSGARARRYLEAGTLGEFAVHAEPDSVGRMLAEPLDAVCVAAPDDRHFAACQAVLRSGRHLLVEKPSVLSLAELEELIGLAEERGVLARVVYHKLFDPDHRRLRTLVAGGILRHVNHGYCSLLEPRSISRDQFAEWITGRNPASYVAVHWLKLIDFTFFGPETGASLAWVKGTGQRGIVGPANGPTWDSVQMQVGYRYPDGREAAFDIHTGWVTPDNFSGYVEQEVQFRFDNGVWNGHSRKRGVELTVEGLTPNSLKTTINNHYNAPLLDPAERTIAEPTGYGLSPIDRFCRDVAELEFGGPSADRSDRLARLRTHDHADLSADRRVVAMVMAIEAILAAHAGGRPNGVVTVNGSAGGLVLEWPGSTDLRVLHAPGIRRFGKEGSIIEP
jgi:predicted dehydrogenase